VFLLICLLSATAVAVAGQEAPAEPYVVRGDANACELNGLHYHQLMADIASGVETLTITARPGRGDTSRNILRRRLHNVRTYLGKSIPSYQMVITEGERTEGDGRIEFYVGEQLRLVSLSKANKDLCVGCCDFDDPNYYGFGKTDSPKPVRKKKRKRQPPRRPVTRPARR